MTPSIIQLIALFGAALLAGAINSVAGGGSFISFPALVAVGIGEKIANSTNTVALWPGSAASVGAYRNEFVTQRRLLIPLGIASLLGGGIGAIVLLATPELTFKGLLPYLMLFATLVFTFGRPIATRLRGHIDPTQISTPTLGVIMLLQFVTAIYGGFFGGGIGIIMLATLSLIGMKNIHEMNALKTLLATLINGVATLAFVVRGAVVWPEALLMIVAAVIGGYFGAYFAKQVPPQFIRYFVIVVGVTMTIIFFTRANG